MWLDATIDLVLYRDLIKHEIYEDMKRWRGDIELHSSFACDVIAAILYDVNQSLLNFGSESAATGRPLMVLLLCFRLKSLRTLTVGTAMKQRERPARPRHESPLR